MNSNTFATPWGKLQLSRYPQLKNSPLQAFDAADAYALNYLQQQLTPTQQPNQLQLLVFNDSFGAIACALVQAGAKVNSCADSHLAELALQQNIANNQLPTANISFTAATQPPSGSFDWIIIKVPKTLALLEEQLCQLRPLLNAQSKIIACGMVKHLSKSANALFERYIGSVQASLAVKKARLLIVQPDLSKPIVASPYPSNYQLTNPPLNLINHANVFCRENLDIGSRLLLQQLTKINLAPAARVADLGCGNGILALCLAQLQPSANFLLVDESYMAVSSAQTNWQRNVPAVQAQFQVADGLSQQADNSLDLILCNPPFHQQQSLGSFLAWRMLQQAQRSLTSGGQLWLVGNRHLGYHVKLKQLFSQVNQIAANSKFVVLQAIK